MNIIMWESTRVIIRIITINVIRYLMIRLDIYLFVLRIVNRIGYTSTTVGTRRYIYFLVFKRETFERLINPQCPSACRYEFKVRDRCIGLYNSFLFLLFWFKNKFSLKFFSPSTSLDDRVQMTPPRVRVNFMM